MTITFRDLRGIISKCCETDVTAALDQKFSFQLDVAKLENILKQKKTDLHAIGFTKKIASVRPSLCNIYDLQLISEYTEDPDKLQMIFNGQAQIVPFMLFSKSDLDGNIEIKLNEEDAEEISEKDLFNSFNGTTINQDLVMGVLCTAPVYRIIVVRYFNNISERFDYDVLIRTNRPAINLYRAQYGKKPSNSALVKRDVSEEE